jgi:hypothetical protein
VLARIVEAIRRCSPFALAIFVTYVAFSCAGIVMAHAGTAVAVAQRDRIVHHAMASDQASMAYASGNRATAVLADFSGNVFAAAIPQTVAGLGIVLPFFSVAWQGWLGGVVSIDGRHRSRLRTVKGAAYYFGVLLLQFIPFSLSIGAGVRCGIELYRHNRGTSRRFWQYRISREAVADVAYVYALTVPLFLVASAFEFLSSWNA